jgi:hypothetical protein
MSQGVLAREVLRLKQTRDELLDSVSFLKARVEAKALERWSIHFAFRTSLCHLETFFLNREIMHLRAKVKEEEEQSRNEVEYEKNHLCNRTIIHIEMKRA